MRALVTLAGAFFVTGLLVRGRSHGCSTPKR
jgi:hypothetical protein